MYVLPKQVRDVGEHLDSEHASNKAENRKILLTILRNITFLARQGLPLRGDGAEDNSNFKQLLLLQAKDNSRILDWISKPINTFTSKEIQNEILKLMALKLLLGITANIRKAKFFTILADEATDAGNKEQLTIVFRWVDEALLIHEDFIGLHEIDDASAAGIMEMIKQVLLSCNLNVNQLRGQCYDGASVMSGLRNGVAAQVQKLEPRAIYTHCYGHSLNLAAGDTIKRCTVLKKALDITYEMSKLIKYSPKRDAMFSKLKDELQPECPGIRVLCPTRWTVRADSLKSVLDNYTVLQHLWEEAESVAKESDLRARLIGVGSQMTSFDFYFGVYLGEMVLRHTDNLSKTLQKKELSAAEGQQVSNLVKVTLQSMRSAECFHLFWKTLIKKAEHLNVGEPVLPRKRKAPRCTEIGEGTGDFHTTVVDHYRVIYFEAMDLIIQCVDDRFDQPGYKMYSGLETLLLKGCKQLDYQDELHLVKSLYDKDLNYQNLEIQFQTIAPSVKDDLSLGGIVNYLKTLSSAARSIYSEIVTLVELIFVMPATNATSERSFSALRRIKSYLRTTMSQQRLNNLMVLFIHGDSLDEMNLEDVADEFISAKDTRLKIFAKFNK